MKKLQRISAWSGLDVKGDAGPPSGGSDTVFFTFDVKKHNYNVVIALDEVGCGLSGHTCD